MHLQIKEPVMKKETKKTRERKHKDGVANQLRNRAPKKGDIILNFEETTGSDLTEAMDEAKTQSVKEEVKIFAQQVREGLAKGDTLETIKYRLSNDYPSWPIEQIEAFVAKIQKIEAKKAKSEPAPTEVTEQASESKPAKAKSAPAPKAAKEDPAAVATVTTVFEKLMSRFNADKDGALKEATQYVTEVDLLAAAVKRCPATTSMPFNSNRADHYTWIAAQVKKHGADKVATAVKKIYEKNGGIHVQVDQKLLVKP